MSGQASSDDSTSVEPRWAGLERRFYWLVGWFFMILGAVASLSALAGFIASFSGEGLKGERWAFLLLIPAGATITLFGLAMKRKRGPLSFRDYL